jgi:hypothetical protein
MPIDLTDFVNPLGTFPIAHDDHLLGSYRSVADATARDLIPDERRKVGMLVRTNDTGETWVLGPGITNGDWTLSTFLSFLGEAQGDLIYRNATLWTRLAAGTTGQVLRTQGSGANPQWTDQIVVSGEAQGDLIYRNASTWTRLAAGTSGQVLRTQGSGANPQWTDQIVVSGEAQGDLIYRNATLWTRLAAGTSGQVLRTQGSGADPQWTNQIVVSGEAQGDLIYRNASTWTRLAAGTSGQVLRTQGSGADPQWTDQIVISGEAQGDILYRTATTWNRLPAGTSGQFLQTQGTGANPQWATVNVGGGGTPQLVSNNYTILSSDGDIYTDVSSTAIVLTLPATPSLGERHTIKDCFQAANVNNITVNGNGGLIEQFGGGVNTTLTLGQAGDSATLGYNGTYWNIL